MTKKMLTAGALLPLMIASLFLFQNCSQGGFQTLSSANSASSIKTDDTPENPDVLDTDTNTDPDIKQCPQYMAPLCQTGQTILMVTDVGGCEVPTCVSSNANSCPIYAPPTCTANETGITKTNAESCSYLVCQSNASHVCPVYNLPMCPAGQKAVTSVDAYNCSKPVCIPSSNPVTCPAMMAPVCKTDEKAITVQNSAGCYHLKCIPKAICPDTQVPACGSGTLKTEKDANGCSHKVCVSNPNPSCPQYMAPLCSGGKKVVITKDSHGCSVPSCQ